MALKETPSPQEFETNMRNILDKYNDDPEFCHIEMDTYICEMLETMGYKDGIRVFRTTPKWYA